MRYKTQMDDTTDLQSINYELLVEDALRSVVRGALSIAQHAGLPGESHFYVTFLTDAPGVSISDTLKADNPKEMILEAQKLFNRALALDTSYEPAKQNLIVSEFLLQSTQQERCDFVKSLEASNIDSEFITDFKVINAVLESRKPKKINKLALKGSYVSRLNALSSSIEQEVNISSDEVLKRLDIDLMELLMGSRGKKLKDTRFSLKNMNDIQLIEDKKLTVFKIPKKRIEALFTTQEQAVFHTTPKGIYYVYEK